DIAHDRLVASGSRRAFVAAAARLDGAARALVTELARAVDADRTPPRSLRLRDRRLDFVGGAKIMGILNVTPDSFYDGNAYRSVDRARARATEMVALGAAVLDIGGQSYANGATRVDEDEERARVVPVVEALVRDDLGVPLSIDTWKSGVADAALAAGAHLINDCSGLADPALAPTVARYDAALVVMHLKGELNVRDPAGYPYDDALAEILDFLRDRTERALAAGVARDALIVDPGLEFGKEPQTDFEILNRFGDLRSLGYPILFAASRKSFLGRLFDRPAKELLVPSLATAAIGVAAGAALLRVHDIAESAQLVTTIAAVRHGWVDRKHGTEISRSKPPQRRA
ncbi:MAG: dihydropteroate synthase, partial [Candidatus Eremiobacteraeota bacterium]|nr:dihydropteroate synthase [Candidatus Eremiobacteraeota bacterium]